jgi:uncharacterized glyoxalase superfamily protein PhnB
MPDDSPQPAPRVTPYLLYGDVGRALEWLSAAFGFRERLRFAEDDGTITHAEMEVDGGLVMLGDPGPEYKSPNEVGQVTHLVHVYVDDLDAHYERAKQAGATIVSEPKDQEYGDRRYDAKDVEGHLWSFAQYLRDVPAEEWGAIKT